MGVTLQYLFLSFVKIGSTSWGGFMALIAVIQRQMTEKDKKLDNDIILEGITLASVLPGPVAVNVVAYVGYKLRGLKGALISILAILLPSFLFMLLLSDLYLRYGNVPAFHGFFLGVMPAVAAIIVNVAMGMAKKSITDFNQIVIASVAIIAGIFSKSYWITLLVLLLSALAGYILYQKKTIDKKKDAKEEEFSAVPLKKVLIVAAIVVLVGVIFYGAATWTNFISFPLLQKKIAITFSAISLTQFGGGYVIIPSMQKIFVDAFGWLSAKEFTDAVAMGQITPGPIFVVATFIGYKMAGFIGALNATISVFLPSGLLMILCSHYFSYIKKSTIVAAVFQGIKPAVVGMIFSAAVTIAKGCEMSVISLVIFIATLVLSVKFKLNPVYLIPATGIIGMIFLKN